MKVEKQNAPGFQPFSVVFTFETQDDVNAFYGAGEKAYNHSACGSLKERVGIEMMDSVRDHKTDAE